MWIEPVLDNRKLGTIAPEDVRAPLEDAKTAGEGVDTRITIYQTVGLLPDNALGSDGHRCRCSRSAGAGPTCTRRGRGGMSRPTRHIANNQDAVLARMVEIAYFPHEDSRNREGPAIRSNRPWSHTSEQSASNADMLSNADSEVTRCLPSRSATSTLN